MSEEIQILTRWVDPTIDDFKIALEEANKQIEEDNKEIERLRSIIKEVRECINHYAIEDEDFSKIYNQEEQELLEILDKVEKENDIEFDVLKAL